MGFMDACVGAGGSNDGSNGLPDLFVLFFITNSEKYMGSFTVNVCGCFICLYSRLRNRGCTDSARKKLVNGFGFDSVSSVCSSDVIPNTYSMMSW